MSEPQAMLAVAESDITVLENILPTLPDHIKNLPDAVATMLVARELGLAPLSSFPDLMIIGGNVGMTSKLMLALVLKAGHRTKVIEMSGTRASIQAWRKFDGEWEDCGEFEFTEEQAVTANLWAKDTYELYPSDMLMNKAVARMVRFAFPDVLRGYVPDEMTDITGVEFEHAIHLDPTEQAMDYVEVVEALDAEIVEE
jgi:hypothetical protein